MILKLGKLEGSFREHGFKMGILLEKYFDNVG